MINIMNQQSPCVKFNVFDISTKLMKNERYISKFNRKYEATTKLIQIRIKISVSNFANFNMTYLCCLIQFCVTLKSGGSGSGSGAGGLNLMGFCVCCFRILSMEDGLKRLFCKWACFGGLGGGSMAEAGVEVTITLDFSDSEDES